MQILTLATSDYAYGVAALCNSLAAVGFKGEIHVGHIGELPWAIKPGAPIVLHPISDAARRAYVYKPEFILATARGPFLFIDADCLIMHAEFLSTALEALNHGPVLCAEGIVPSQDVRRLFWRQFKAGAGRLGSSAKASTSRCTDTYFNSGFFGGHLPRDRWILEGWKAIIDTALTGSGAMFESARLPMCDQDCLNAFVQDEEFNFHCFSPPDVWYAVAPSKSFLHVGLMEQSLLHCTGEKPWQLKTVPARTPTVYEMEWYRFLWQEAVWAEARPELRASVERWLANSAWGRVIAKMKSVGRRLRV